MVGSYENKLYDMSRNIHIYIYINIRQRGCKVFRNTNLMCFPSWNTIRYEICPQCIRERQQDLYYRSAFRLDKFTLFDILVIKYVGICAPLVLKDNSNRYKKESLFIGFNICKKSKPFIKNGLEFIQKTLAIVRKYYWYISKSNEYIEVE